MHGDSRIPLYMQIKEHFKESIVSHKLHGNDRIPSEKELMKQFDVSRITVANALASLAKEGWIYRIPGRGSFVRGGADEVITLPTPVRGELQNQIASMNSSIINMDSGAKMIGLIMSTIDDFFAIRLLRGIQEVINDSEYKLLLIISSNSKEREKEAITELRNLGVVGLIILPVEGEVYNEEILAMKMNGYPFVLVDRTLPGVETNYVTSDGSLGAQMAVAHLYELGHRDIAICSDAPMPTTSVEDRLAGYLKELKLRGSMINPAFMLTEFKVDYSNFQADHPLYRYVKNHLATAYIALNSKLGMLLYRISRHLGIRVPEEMSIITFDDPAAEYDFSEFTHISQSEDLMGKEAARTLLEVLSEDESYLTSNYRKIILKPKLVIGNTTAPSSKINKMEIMPQTNMEFE